MPVGMRHFGIEEANDLIPLLSRIFEKVRPMAQQLEELDGGPARDQLAGVIRQELAPLEDMGIEVKALDGLVDFRALRDGRTVYLCWRFGEERISHWHELDSGFAGRRPIRESGEFERTYLS
jgi:hypothetical protein